MPDAAAVLQRFVSNPASVSNEDALAAVKQFLSQAPPEVAEEASQYAFGALPPEARAQVAQGFRAAHNDPSTPFDGFTFDNDDAAATPHGLGAMGLQAARQDPTLLDNLFGKGGFFSGPVGKMLLAGVATYLINRMMSGGRQGVPSGGVGTTAGGGGLGEVLGGLLGGAAAGGAAGSQGGLGEVLGGLLGGAAAGGAAGSQGGMPAGAQNPGALGEVLGGLLGGQGGLGSNLDDVLGGLLGGAAGHGSQGGLGDILGGLLGGGQQAQAGSHHRQEGLSAPGDSQ
jgi:hypothetical protein